MANNSDGGPAFPVMDDVEWESSGHCLELKSPGMTLLDYFAARAPALPLWNFTVDMPCERPVAEWPDEQSKSMDCGPINAEQVETWDRRHAEERAIQWPWIWAAAMLARREKSKGAS